MAWPRARSWVSPRQAGRVMAAYWTAGWVVGGGKLLDLMMSMLTVAVAVESSDLESIWPSQFERIFIYWFHVYVNNELKFCKHEKKIRITNIPFRRMDDNDWQHNRRMELRECQCQRVCRKWKSEWSEKSNCLWGIIWNELKFPCWWWWNEKEEIV